MTILIIILAVVAVIFIINYNGNKHDEEMRKLAEQKKSTRSSLNQYDINNKIMDVVHAMGDGKNAQYWEGSSAESQTKQKPLLQLQD